MIRNSTLPRVGRVGKRWNPWRRSQHAVVVARAGGICEGCGQDGRRLEVAHLFGRRNIIGEPWASWHGLCAHLCGDDPAYGQGCHSLIDQNKDLPLQRKLRGLAADRLAWYLNYFEGLADLPYIDFVRGLVRYAVANRIEP